VVLLLWTPPGEPDDSGSMFPGLRNSTPIVASSDDLAGAETRIVTTHESMSDLALIYSPWIPMTEWYFRLGGREILLASTRW
jgi:hypothetical protein